MTWRKPLKLRLVETSDGESFKIFSKDTTGVPVGSHPGAFGVVRKHHVHEGVDLYAPVGTPVYAVESGAVVRVLPMTGPAAGSPWWFDTKAVMVEGRSGVVVYGEISPAVQEGRVIFAGDVVGHVIRVLRHDKGRPTSMLHLELHRMGSRSCLDWNLPPAKPPEQLLDPTPHLLQICRRHRK